MIKSDFRKEMKAYQCTLTPLTPIHIGSGNELTPYNYVIKNDIFYRISLEKVIPKLSLDERNELVRILESDNFVKIRSFIQKVYKPEYGYYYSCSVDEDVIIKYASKITGAQKSNEENKLSVEEFIGNYLGKYIPGSSLKGAIRSAYLGSNMTPRQYYTVGRNDRVKTKPFRAIGDGRKESDRREATIIGLSEKNSFYDPFKKLLVKDSECLKDLVEVREVERVNKKQNMPLGSYEVTKSILSSGDIMEINFELDINNVILPNEDFLNEFYLEKNRKADREIITEYKNLVIDKDKKGGLFYCLNEKAVKVLEEDRKFFDRIGNREGIEACKKLKKYLSELKSNEVLIKFGKGAGFNSTTLNVFNKEVQEVFTRTTVSGLPCGWAILSYKEKR